MGSRIFFRVVSLLLFQSGLVYADDAAYEQSCRAFFSKTEGLEGGLSKKEEFASSALAIREIKLGAEYPEFPKTKEDLLLEILSSNDSDPAAVAALETRLNSPSANACNPVEYFSWLKRLIKSSSAFKFNGNQKQRLMTLLTSHLRSDALAPRPLMEIQLDLKLVRYANEMSLLKLSAGKVQALEAALSGGQAPVAGDSRRIAKIEESESELVTPPGSAVEKSRERHLLRRMRNELRESERLRNVLQAVLGIEEEAGKK
jgi:hypothetical protein